jgi:predicted kinase
MPILVLLNGPPASGKSTVAEMIVATRPLALNLDIDLIRELLGDWRSQPNEAGLAARRLALSMAANHLHAGNDVIVPQFLARQDFINQLALAAAEAGAQFVEIALILDRSKAIEAFEYRSAHPSKQQHRDVAAIVNQSGGSHALALMHDEFTEMLTHRPNVHAIEVVSGDIEETVQRVSAVITRHQDN